MISIVMPFKHIPELIEMTARTIKNVRETTKQKHELIIVHHGGGKNEQLQRLVDKYVFLPEESKSLSATYNIGFQRAAGEVFVNIHNDVELPEAWDGPLSAAARSGFIGCVFTDEANSDCAERGIEKAGLKYIPSCCFSISKSNWENLSGYDEQFEGYHWEDNDLFLRGSQIGCGPVRCDVTVKHKRGMTRTSIGVEVSDKYLIANKDRYYQKHFNLFKENGLYFLVLPDYANFKEVVA